MHISYNSDDSDRRVAVICELAADRVFSWPQQIGHFLINDGKLSGIVLAKRTPGDEPDVHRFEVSRIDKTGFRPCVSVERFSYWPDSVNCVIASKWKNVHDTGRFDSGKRADAIEQLALRGQHFRRVGIKFRAERNTERQQALRIESRVYIHHV